MYISLFLADKISNKRTPINVSISKPCKISPIVKGSNQTMLQCNDFSSLKDKYRKLIFSSKK